MSRSNRNRKKKGLTRREQRAALAAQTPELAAQTPELAAQTPELAAQTPELAAVDPALSDPEAARQRRRDLWSLGIRLAIPVFGVLVLGWPQITAALFYIFEAWLFVLARVTTEQLVNREFRRSTGYSTFRILISSLLGVGFVVAMLGGVSIAMLIDEFLENEWQEFAAGGWRDPFLLASILYLLIEQVLDVFRFARSYRERSAELEQRQEIEKVSRILALIACNFIVGIGQVIGFPGFVQILAMSGVMWAMESSIAWYPAAKRGRQKARQKAPDAGQVDAESGA